MTWVYALPRFHLQTVIISFYINLRKEKSLRNIVSVAKIATSVLLTLFINGYEYCHINVGFML